MDSGSDGSPSTTARLDDGAAARSTRDASGRGGSTSLGSLINGYRISLLLSIKPRFAPGLFKSPSCVRRPPTPALPRKGGGSQKRRKRPWNVPAISPGPMSRRIKAEATANEGRRGIAPQRRPDRSLHASDDRFNPQGCFYAPGSRIGCNGPRRSLKSERASLFPEHAPPTDAPSLMEFPVARNFHVENQDRTWHRPHPADQLETCGDRGGSPRVPGVGLVLWPISDQLASPDLGAGPGEHGQKQGRDRPSPCVTSTATWPPTPRTSRPWKPR